MPVVTLRRCLFRLRRLLHSDLSQFLTSLPLCVSAVSPYTDINECNEAERNGEDLCGAGGACKNIAGSYRCRCPKGYTNYGNNRTRCSSECTHAHADVFIVAAMALLKYNTSLTSESYAVWCRCLYPLGPQFSFDPPPPHFTLCVESSDSR